MLRDREVGFSKTPYSIRGKGVEGGGRGGWAKGYKQYVQVRARSSCVGRKREINVNISQRGNDPLEMVNGRDGEKRGKTMQWYRFSAQWRFDVRRSRVPYYKSIQLVITHY